MTTAPTHPLDNRGWLASASPALLLQLAREAQWQRYEPGRTLLQADRLPHQVLLIQQGRVRLVGTDPITGPFTLARLGPGQAIGWVGLVRGQPCETALAMEPTVVAAIPARRFLALLEELPELSELVEQVHPSEAAEVLLTLWNQQPQQRPRRLQELQELLAAPERLREQLQVQNWIPGPASVEPKGLPSEDPAWHWCWSGLPARGRRLGIAPRLLQPPSPSASGATGAGKGNANGAPQQLSHHEWPEAPPLPEPLDPASLGLPRPGPSAPLPTGSGGTEAAQPVGSAVLALQHLARLLGTPIPLEVVRQILSDQAERFGGLRLNGLANLMESLGLEARPLGCPPSHVHRLEGPALLLRGERFVVLEQASGAGWTLMDPAEGRCQLSLAHVKQEWPEGLELVLARQPLSTTDEQDNGRFDLAWFWKALRPYRPQLAVLLLNGLVAKLLELVFPLAVLQIIDVVVGSRNGSLLLPIGIVLGLTALVMGVLAVLKQLLLADLADRIDTTLGSQIVGHLFRLPLRFFDRRTVGDLASRLHDLQQVRQFLTDTAIGGVIDLIFLPLLLPVLFAIQPTLALIVLLQVPLLLLINAASGPLTQNLLTRRNNAWSRSQSLLVEVLSAIRTVKSQNFASQARFEWLRRYRRFTGDDYRLTRNRAVLKESSSVVLNGFKVLLFLVAAVLVLNNQASVGAIFAVYLLSSGVTAPLLNLASITDQFRDAKAAMAAVADVIGQPPEESAQEARLPMAAVRGAITFENVSFSYKAEGPRQLDQLNLAIEPGSFVGLVGMSGSGKSTVVQLIDGLYRPRSGRVFIDGLDISQVQLSSLRQQVGFVPQESILFEGSVLDNLRLNHPEAPLEAVMAAARVACADDFISELPEGYLTSVGERGGGISGGQKQRLAIARMLLMNPRLVILDEATSALDADTERRLVEQLRQHVRGRTLLFVTHRLGNLRQADRILVMEQGRIIEDGTWAELIQRRGAFAALARQQHEEAG
jgi:ATP-binding cassette subfamily B protein